jgi:hypothetical protein
MVDPGGNEASRLRRHGLGSEFLVCALVLAAAVGLGALLVWFMNAHGDFLSGDEPTYIVEARALLHLSPHIGNFLPAQLTAHVRPVPTQPMATEGFVGVHGRVGSFEPGLGLLLAPFVAFGSLYNGAVLGILILNSAGLILIHRRATRLTGLGRRGQVLLAVTLACPAMLVAMTQIYPDVISGILIACAVLEIAIVERSGELTRTGLAVVAVAVMSLPWLQPKNFAPAIVLVGAFVLVS